MTGILNTKTEKTIKGFPKNIDELFNEQLANWELAKNNFECLKSVKTKTFKFDGFEIRIQFNPGRIISSSAKVDAKSIKERACFLCKENLPAQQNSLDIAEKFMLLVNPYPIFPKHFTVPQYAHKPQELKEHFSDLIQVSYLLGSGYTIFYNGPKCGASAPDHFHFQAGNFGFMPIDNEYDYLLENKGKTIGAIGKARLSVVKNYLRDFISIDSDSQKDLLMALVTVYSSLKLNLENEEPMMNVLSTYNEKGWRVIIFPREKHRPEQYFLEDGNQILLSPASVDLGGVCITPREEDFNKITKDDIIDIFNQITYSDLEFDNLIRRINSNI